MWAATPSTAAPVVWRPALLPYTDVRVDRGPLHFYMLKANSAIVTPTSVRMPNTDLSLPCCAAAALLHRRWGTPCVTLDFASSAEHISRLPIPVPAADPVVRRIGCFVDDVVERAMPLRLASADRGMTPARCTQLGHIYGLMFVGLQVRTYVVSAVKVTERRGLLPTSPPTNAQCAHK